MSLPRSDHFNGKTFFQAHHHHALRRLNFWRWQFTSNFQPWPKHVAIAPQPPPPRPRAGEGVVTWIGHATFLIQTPHANFLTDPVFSERASPVTWAGPRRVHPPGVTLDALPRIDAVLLSHDHYDHCDVASLRALAAKFPDAHFIAPLRHRDLLEAAGARRVVELDWWETREIADVRVSLTPGKHWSNRLGTPRNHRLWGGFFLEFSTAAPRRLWFVGDTGYDAEIFRAVRSRCGAPDLALVPIGAYEPRWFMAPMHINPAEAVQLHRDVGAKRSLGMHWGTFQLTEEAREAPVAALALARRAAGVAEEEFQVVDPGASVLI